MAESGAAKNVLVELENDNHLPGMFRPAAGSGFRRCFVMQWDGGPGDPCDGRQRLVPGTLKNLAER